MSKTDPEMEGRNRDPERESKRKKEREGHSQRLEREREGHRQFPGKKKKPLTFAAHKGRKNCH